MSYTLILPPDTQNEIREYIFERYLTVDAQRAAVAELVAELEKLAVNPGSAARPTGDHSRDGRSIGSLSEAVGQLGMCR